MSNRFQRRRRVNDVRRISSMIASWPRRVLLLLLLTLTMTLQGCFLDRLITLRGQTCTFDQHFGIGIDSSIEIDFYDPVLIEKDMDLIWGFSPTAVESSGTARTLVYQFERVPGDSNKPGSFLMEEIHLEFDFVSLDDQLRLSKISSNDLPGELLPALTAVDLSTVNAMADSVCQVELNPFTRSVILPLDPGWFAELPDRDEFVELFGVPNSTLDGGQGLVYEYRLNGSGKVSPIARLTIWYDPTGQQALIVEADFSRYQMQTDLLSANMQLQFTL
jgi:hypothetical protein